ncbi:hypothetical protein [Nonomuraea sp. NPDC049400]|uniref:hypothetical protein n=1 Tax=Nonomuraea sp. NPDC049400 TaxID=3364352 RepID=UPI00378F90B6
MNTYAFMGQSIRQEVDTSVHSPAWDRIKSKVLGPDESEVQGERIASWSLSSNLFSAIRARRLIRTRLAAWGLAGPAAAAERLAGELVADAVRQARGPYRLTVWATGGLLRCEVEAATGAPAQRHPAVFEQLACCWGTSDKTLWFELPA